MCIRDRIRVTASLQRQRSVNVAALSLAVKIVHAVLCPSAGAKKGHTVGVSVLDIITVKLFQISPAKAADFAPVSYTHLKRVKFDK